MRILPSVFIERLEKVQGEKIFHKVEVNNDIFFLLELFLTVQ